jgi:DNA invertase Pin-like site-specific DNA recombinase
MPRTPRVLAPLAYSYIRFSHPEQAKGDSLRRQMKAALAWCKRHKISLDESTTFRDLGKSAFLGDHRKNPDRNALASFLEMVKDGRIPPGSYLIIENLDRLTREDIQPALHLCLGLLLAGIRVVQLKPTELTFDNKSDAMHVMMMIMELNRGHSESAIKSERLRDAWSEKRRQAVLDKRPITRACPEWLRVVGDTPADYRFELIAERVEVVQRIFRLAGEGYSICAIACALNKEGVPTFGRTKKGVLAASRPSRHWTRPYLAKVLSGREALGEFQPYRREGGRRVPDGKPIAGYYPAVVTETAWEVTQAGRQWRRSKKGSAGAAGRPGRVLDLFRGLLHEAVGGGRIHVRPVPKNNYLTLIPYGSEVGDPTVRRTRFPAPVFEREVLARLREIDPRSILPKGDDTADKVLTLTRNLTGVESRIAAIQAQLVEGGDVRAALEALRTLEGRQKAAALELAEARRKAATPTSQAWADYGTLVDVLAQAPDPEAARTRLRAVLRQMVTGVWCVFVRQGAWRFCACQVHFEGDGSRNYLIVHRQAFNLPKGGTTPAQTYTRDFADAMPAVQDLDLRRKKDAARLVKVLATFDADDLAKLTTDAA